jgi:membrane fusion protein, multidrug efflux system
LNPNRLPWLILAALPLAVGSCVESKKADPPPPPTVYVTTVVRRDVPLFIEAVGTLDGYINAEMRARVRGYLRSQDYKDGSAVKAGETLFTIEPNEYATALASARAALSRARVNQAHSTVQRERDRGLFKTGMISEQDLDNVTATLADAEGQVQAAQAQVAQAELNLSYTQVRSPIEGVAGLALVRVGNLVGQDSPTLLTTVSRIDPIRVNFTMSEVDYVKYPDRFKKLEQRDLAWAKAQFARVEAGAAAENGDRGIDLVLADGSVYPHRGITTSVDRQIDPTTGTIRLQALIPNPDGALRPGQYGHVRIRREDAGHDVLVVPEKAFISVQGSSSLGVVGPDNKVQLRRVDVGPAASGMRIVDKGVSEGERVVVEGVQKIADGATVDPKPAPEAPGAQSSVPAAANQARPGER